MLNNRRLIIRSQRGGPLLILTGYIHRCERKKFERTYWLCIGYKHFKCTGRIICDGNDIIKYTKHNHEPDWKRINASKIESVNLLTVDKTFFN